MFADAYELAAVFTHPVVISLRFFDGILESSPAAFVIINRDGWIVTAAHVLNPNFQFQRDALEIAEYERKVQAINQNVKLSDSAKRTQIRQLPSNPKWLRNASHFWSVTNELRDVQIWPEADLAVGRIPDFNASSIGHYPVFKNPSHLRFGTSLCKLGFPFYVLTPTFDENANVFNLPPDAFPMPRFPIEGIYTRNILVGKSRDGETDILFLETSSPGLRGQSGGPIFDTQGRIWGIQSSTIHLDLGFSPEVDRNGRRVTEHQFLNVGIGVHPEMLVAFFRQHGIDFALSDD